MRISCLILPSIFLFNNSLEATHKKVETFKKDEPYQTKIVAQLKNSSHGKKQESKEEFCFEKPNLNDIKFQKKKIILRFPLQTPTLEVEERIKTIKNDNPGYHKSDYKELNEKETDISGRAFNRLKKSQSIESGVFLMKGGNKEYRDFTLIPVQE